MTELGGKRLSVYIRGSDNSLTLTQVRQVIRRETFRANHDVCFNTSPVKYSQKWHGCRQSFPNVPDLFDYLY